MKLSTKMKRVLVDELTFALEKMKESKSAAEKLYFFSAAYGAVHRVMNIEFDDELIFIHVILNASYVTMNQRMVSSVPGGEAGAVRIPERMFVRIEEGVGELIDTLKSGDEPYPALKKIANAAYAATGNGYYLHLKGLLVV